MMWNDVFSAPKFSTSQLLRSIWSPKKNRLNEGISKSFSLWSCPCVLCQLKYPPNVTAYIRQCFWTLLCNTTRHQMKWILNHFCQRCYKALPLHVCIFPKRLEIMSLWISEEVEGRKGLLMSINHWPLFT